MTKSEMEPDRLPSAWTYVPGLVVAVVLLYPNFLQPSQVYAVKFEIASLGLAALSVSGIVTALFRWKAARVLAIAILALYWMGVGAVCFVILLNPVFILLYYGIFIIPAFLVVGLCTAYARRGLKHAWWKRSAVTGFGCGFIGLVVLAAPSLKRTADRNQPWTRPTEPFVLGENMFKLVKCSRQFATQHPMSGYPESLDQVGPNGTGCLPEDSVTGFYKGFSVSYHPGMRSAHGTIDSFTINAEQAVPHGPDFTTMSTDESGFVLYKYEGPHGKGIPLSYSPGESAIETLVGCLSNAVNQNQSDLPQSAQDFQKCLGNSYIFTKVRSGEVGAYTFAYNFEHNDSGAIDGFTAEVRPRTYGIGGVRSYLIVGKLSLHKSASGPPTETSSLRVHATPEDRSAKRSDPLANRCEITWIACIGPAQIN
jgi:hypothetical protein